MGKKWKAVISVVIGFAFAMVLMSIFIYFGYSNAYSADAEEYTVYICGLPIYILTKAGTAYSGATVGVNMGIICGICMLLSFAGERIICRLRHK